MYLLCLPANVFPHTTNLYLDDLCKVGFGYVKSHLPRGWSILIQVCRSVELFEECCITLWHQKLTAFDAQRDAGQPNIH